MKLSEQYEEIIGWNEDSGTTHVRNEVAQLEAALTLIGDVAYDRDGHTGDSVKLGELVNEIYGYAVDALKEGE